MVSSIILTVTIVTKSLVNVITINEPAHYGRCRCETTTWVDRLGSCAGGLGRAEKFIFSNYSISSTLEEINIFSCKIVKTRTHWNDFKIVQTDPVP